MSPRRREAPGPRAVDTMTDAVRRGILQGSLAPGAPLREEELAREHGVSRHTARAVLARLADERLVRVEAYRGARVASLDDDELQALQELRGALETAALRLAVRRGPSGSLPPAAQAAVAEALADLEAAEAASDWLRTVAAHTAVHQALVDAGGSPRISEAYARLESELNLMLTRLRPEYPAGALTAEHRAYVEATLADPETVVRAHLAHSTALIREARVRGSVSAV